MGLEPCGYIRVIMVMVRAAQSFERVRMVASRSRIDSGRFGWGAVRPEFGKGARASNRGAAAEVGRSGGSNGLLGAQFGPSRGRKKG